MKVLVGSALVLLCGCAAPERADEQAALIETRLQNDTFSVTDNVIVAVDGKRFARPVYAARVPPGARTVGVQGTLRVSKQVRQQFCGFDLNAEPGCTYRLSLPAYPRSALEQPADAEWRVIRPMTIVAECADTSYAVQVSLDCAGRP